MLNFNIKKEYTNRIWLLDVAIIFVIVFVLFAALYLIFEKKYENKIYPGVYLGGESLGGKTLIEIKEFMNERVNEISRDGITFRYNENKTIIMPIISSLEPGLAYEIINFNIDNTTTHAYYFGRNNNFFINSLDKIKSLIFHEQISMQTTINKEKINQALKDSFSLYEIPAENAKLIFKKQNLIGGLENLQIDISEEKLGKIIDYKKGIVQLKNQLAMLNNNSIELFTKTDYPKIYKRDCLNIKSKAQKILKLSPLILKYGDKKWNVNNEQLAGWLTLIINPDYSEREEDKITVGLDAQVVEQYLKNEIAVKINKEPSEAKFEIKNSRVTEFQAGSDGMELNIKASFTNMKSELMNKNNEVKLTVNELKSNNSVGDVNDLGIKEIIGIGESNFAGSPANRRHNIRIGADTLNGILIKPEEEFSLLNALGKIDGSTGYLQELVIKNNKTIPEYGGGLCQIGTTIFRSALATGLPITMRRNHSYRVSYYEPAGTDATIYIPWPDFKFINDTPNYILIQSRIEGDKLYFDFWGSEDGRFAEQTDPIIYNIVRPGATKLIETLDLEPGIKKCTERAHNGADAYFDYKVTYANGEKKEKRFSSHYVPWREVCLIGVEKLTEENNTATSTDNAVE